MTGSSPLRESANWLRRPRVFGAARLIAVALFLGWLYGWAGPRIHPPQTQFGLPYGVAHGALMPMALPALIMGKDVTIYSESNNGRPYKIGYIIGINLCGLVFFGSAFWQPRRQPDSDAAPQSAQPR